MGNRIDTSSSHRPFDQVSDYSSPGSMSDSASWGFPEPRSLNSPVSLQLEQCPRFTLLPKEAQSLVPRFLDVPSLKNLRLSGKDGAALCKSWWIGNAAELAQVLQTFNPQRIDGLTLDGWEFTNAHMQELPASLTRLKFLNQNSQTQITEAGFAHLHGTRLRHLDLREFSGMNDACMAHLRGMPLENLHLSFLNQITDTGLENLQGMPLRQVGLPSTHVTDAGIAYLPLRFLDKVNLRGSKYITDATLTRLSQASIRQLELDFSLNITDHGIKALRDSQTEYLSLTGCNSLTSACFDDLCAMPSLQRLNLSHCDQISYEETLDLQARLKQKNPAFIFGSNL